MKEIKITIVSEEGGSCHKTSGITDVVLQNHSSLFRHEVEWYTGKSIVIELIEDTEVIKDYKWTYNESDFDHYDNIIIELTKEL